MSRHIKTYRILGREGVVHHFVGRQLSAASSRRPTHVGHPTLFSRDDVDELDYFLNSLSTREESLKSFLTMQGVVFDTDGLPNESDASGTSEVWEALVELTNIRMYRKDAQDSLVLPDRFMAPGGRCSTCRWFEVQIYRIEHMLVCDQSAPDDVMEGEVIQFDLWDGMDPDMRHKHQTHCFEGGEPSEPQYKYALVTYGRSIVPGECPKRRVNLTNSAFTVLDDLIQRNGAKGPFLPRTSSNALTEASALDADLAEVYKHRKVI